MSDEREQSSGECFCVGAGPAFTKFARSFGPPEAAATHFRAARVEFLRGLRELIDQRIETLSKPAGNRGSKIDVE